jgi:hypothetical protein
MFNQKKEIEFLKPALDDIIQIINCNFDIEDYDKIL